MSINSFMHRVEFFDSSSIDASQLKVACTEDRHHFNTVFAGTTIEQIPIYEGDWVRQIANDETSISDVVALKQEWAQVLLNGAGVVVIRQAIDDLPMLEQVTDCFNQLVAEEAKHQSGSDHFAPAGSNTRIWNAHEKLCMAAPELFARYYANDVFSLVCHAWLGPGFQITAQANIVHPGGIAQHCHRDYHMGFQTQADLHRYPSHIHSLSPLLTLQGAIAHTDMPIASGPTKLLPYSQRLVSGYLAAGNKACANYFEEHCVQVALNRGDMLFFNPALMHAAGDNKTIDIDRFANLVQVSSAYGRSMEWLDRSRMALAVYPVLQKLAKSDDWTPQKTQQVIEATAEGYPFPANMELEPPSNGLAPLSQQQIMVDSLDNSDTPERFGEKLQKQCALKRSH